MATNAHQGDAYTRDARASERTWTRWPFRLASTVAAVLLGDQAVFAGQFLAGSYPALLTHRENATYAGIAVLVALAAAVLIRWPGRGPWWPAAATLGLFGLIALQIVLGFARAVALHVPLGVGIIVLAVGLTLWSWRNPPRPGSGAETGAAGASRSGSAPRHDVAQDPR
ncbi:hypothetical protein [Microbacterium sp. 22242]|uniref:hypothetical protein n=1 Tax=Microbacterium sp. 22242 TaxID=3453896 RepID=UPI003F84B181